MAQIKQLPGGEMRALLSEIVALAIRLRRGFPQDPEQLPAGGQEVLETLEAHGDQTVPQIARLRGTSRQNIQILVNKLQGDGCIELTNNPAHKRSNLVRATNKGSARLLNARRARQTSLETLSSVVPQADVLATTATLRRIRQTFLNSTEPVAQLPRSSAPRSKRVRAVPQATERADPEEYQFPINLL